MGVDYTAKFGIGVRVLIPEEEYGDEYMEQLTEGSPYNYIQEGDENYGGDANWWYIIIDKPFSDGFCALGDKAEELIKFLKANNVEYKGEVDLVGGLYIW